MKLEDRQPENSSFDVLRMSRKHLGKTIHGDLGKENKLLLKLVFQPIQMRLGGVGTPRWYVGTLSVRRAKTFSADRNALQSYNGGKLTFRTKFIVNPN